MVSGICGLVFVLINAVFALVLLIMVLISSIYAIVSKNPDTRYQPMRDDRGSFIKSQSNLNAELDALAITARGDMKQRNLDDDSDSFASEKLGHNRNGLQGTMSSSAVGSAQHVNTYGQPPASPITASTPFIPGNNMSRHGTPDHSGNRPIYTSDGFTRPGRTSPSRYNQGYNEGGYGYDRSQSLRSDTSYRAAGNGGSQWQRGAGYDH